jgi:hypothetical protein
LYLVHEAQNRPLEPLRVLIDVTESTLCIVVIYLKQNPPNI